MLQFSCMNLSVGIIGLPNVGKSTLFNALIKRQLAKVAEYPFTTIEPHEGVIDIPDKRLTGLTLMVKPQKSTPATITFVDIAGLVKGAHKGEGMGNEFLSYIKKVDAILQVVRAFESETAQHTLKTIDPQRDIEIVNTELILKDLDTVERLIEKEKDLSVKNLLSRIKDHLNQCRPLLDFSLTEEEKNYLQGLQLLSAKPMFYVMNISEKELSSPKLKSLEEKNFLIICARLEAEILELSSLEQAEYLKSYNIELLGLEKVIKRAYEILNLITFFTIKGGREVRAWSIKKGTKAEEAAGIVHTDMRKGFIKAEVINYSQLSKIGSWQKAQQDGKIRLEGKDYEVEDGDVVEFKFKI